MKIQVRLFAVFREGRFSNKDLDFPDGTSLGDVLTHLDIVRANVGILMVNGKGEPNEHVLADGDVIAVFPAVGGG